MQSRIIFLPSGGDKDKRGNEVSEFDRQEYYIKARTLSSCTMSLRLVHWLATNSLPKEKTILY
jgi:hypothetical protein